jgi:hypothetical protein
MSDLRVVHASPGRLRLRVPASSATDELPAAVLREPGVAGCRWSPRTLSLVVLYRPDAVDAATLTDAIARVTGTRVSASDSPGQGSAPVEPGAALSGGLRDAVGVVDRRVRQASRGTLSLGALLPLALIGWAVVELARGRTGPLAWSTALWYAHGLYRDYSLPPSGE